MERKPTVVFDFDGVIHSYKSGWQGAGNIPDPAVPGIKEAVAEIRESGYRVVVVSTRCVTEEGMEAVRRYLQDNEIDVDDIMNEKPPAVCYIDDRAICFRGDATRLSEQVRRFKTWMEEPNLADNGQSIKNCVVVHLNAEESVKELIRILEKEPLSLQCVELDPSLIQGLRPCRAVVWRKGWRHEVVGRFHRWGDNYEEFDAGPGNYTTALVELEDGKIVACIADSVQFLDRVEIDERR